MIKSDKIKITPLLKYYLIKPMISMVSRRAAKFYRTTMEKIR
jgi:hypothetical protein